MHVRLLFVAIFVLGFLGAAVSADDEVMVRSRDKPAKGVIKSESSRGIELKEIKGTKEATQAIPAEAIIDIIYEVTPVEARLSIYKPAVQSEKEYNDPDPKKDARRKANLADALKKYADAYSKVKEIPAKRHIEFKLAVLTLRHAQDENADLGPALKRLGDFKTRHPSSWQIIAVCKLLGQLQAEARQYKEAEASYQDLVQADVSEDTKHEAELLAIQVGIKASRHELAQKKLQALAARLPRDSKFQGRIKIAEAECLAAGKKDTEALVLLRQISKETDDNYLKALAYNALGVNFYQRENIKEARWEFLWVDVVYNQDRAEHAKALYYLAKIFDKLDEKERAQECRDSLIGDRTFAGSEWQRLMLKETSSKR